MLVKNFLLGVGVTNASKEEILEYLIKGLKEPSEKYYIVTPNPEILVYASRHKDFKKILNNARLALPDGIGVIWAGKILGKRFKQKITGVDFMKKVCEKVSEKPITIGLMGGRGGVADRTAECLRKKYPGLKIGFIGEEWPNVKVGHEIDILFVAYGFPKQEIWMSENLDKLPVKVMMGVGGAFDYISGEVPRAPVWVQKIGFEWFYRLVHEPWRLKRQLALLEFIYLVLKEKILSFPK
ncbi:MAG: WecB/TagA/CpsF family glycosyltransferase [Patescibacteria group bacterium]|nr:WecB/TagA/CpsF family glycosyltransferase [Patescibacteria group bacterium]